MLNMNDGPYRDNLESHVKRNEKRIAKIERQLSEIDNVPGIWGSIKSLVYNLTHPKSVENYLVVLGMLVVGIVFTVGLPACMQSCHEEQAQKRKEATKQWTSACNALGLSFVKYHDGYQDEQYIVCAGEDRVTYINPARPDKSYIRTVDEMEKAKPNFED